MFVQAKFRVFILTLGLFFTWIFSISTEIQGQSTDPVVSPIITAENVNQLVVSERFGTGVFSDAFDWSADGTTLAIGGATGVWFYRSADLESSKNEASPTPFNFLSSDQTVVQVTFSPYGNYLTYVTDTANGYLLDYPSLNVIKAFGNAQVFAFDPTTSLLAVGMTVYVNDQETGMGYSQSNVEFHDLISGEIRKTFKIAPHSWGGIVVNLDFSADGSLFAASWQSEKFDTCGERYLIVRWWTVSDLLTLSEDELNDYKYKGGGSIGGYDVKFHPTENALVTIPIGEFHQLGSRIKLYFPLTDEIKIYSMGGDIIDFGETGTGNYYENIKGFDFLDEGRELGVIITDSGKDVVRLLDWKTGMVTRELLFGGDISSIRFTPRLTVNTGERFRIGRSEYYTGGNLVSLSTNRNQYTSLINDEGTAFITYNYDGTQHLWAVNGDQIQEKAIPEDYEQWNASFVPGGQLVKFDGWDRDGDNELEQHERRFALWNYTTDHTIEFDASNLLDNWQTVDFSANGQRMALQRLDGLIEIYDTVSGDRISTLKLNFDERIELAWMPDGSRLTTANFVDTGDPNTSYMQIREWDSTTSELQQNYGDVSNSGSFQSIKQGGIQIYYSTNGQRLTIVSSYIRVDTEKRSRNFADVRVVDTTTRAAIFTYLIEDSYFTSGLFSDDLNYYALDLGDWSNTSIHLFDVSNNQEMIRPGEFIHSSYAGGPSSFSPENQQLLVSVSSYTNCGGDTRQLLLFDVQTHEQSAKISLPGAFMGYGTESELFSHDGTLLMLSDTVKGRFYNPASGELLAEFSDLDNSDLRLNPEGNLLFAARPDGTVTVWKIDQN